jgi:hypothetical protein
VEDAGRLEEGTEKAQASIENYQAWRRNRKSASFDRELSGLENFVLRLKPVLKILHVLLYGAVVLAQRLPERLGAVQ